MTTNRPELASEKFSRWAGAVWPVCVGVFGMALITFDALVFPPPDTATMSAGTACIVGFGAVKLIRFERRSND